MMFSRFKIFAVGYQRAKTRNPGLNVSSQVQENVRTGLQNSSGVGHTEKPDFCN